MSPTSCLSGLETMHLLTMTKNYELRVDLENFDGQRAYAHYSSFTVGPETDRYKLTLGGYVGGAAGMMSLLIQEFLTS